MDKNLFAAIVDKPVETIDVPEWGQTICLRAMSALERLSFFDEAGGSDDPKATERKMRGLLAKCLCDADGRRILSDSDEDIELLGTKSHVVLDRLIKDALRVNGMGQTEREEIEKNSEAGESNPSSSDSPAT
jgi:hypothetical protein